jgi:hypothetical protein
MTVGNCCVWTCIINSKREILSHRPNSTKWARWWSLAADRGRQPGDCRRAVHQTTRSGKDRVLASTPFSCPHHFHINNNNISLIIIHRILSTSTAFSRNRDIFHWSPRNFWIQLSSVLLFLVCWKMAEKKKKSENIQKQELILNKPVGIVYVRLCGEFGVQDHGNSAHGTVLRIVWCCHTR